MTGNLAVTNADSAEVMIFKRARGKPRIYTDPQAIMEVKPDVSEEGDN
jgi:hypothetical protein